MTTEIKSFVLPEVTWRTRFNALAAIAKKDWHTFTRYPLNIVSNILQPLVWLTPIYFMGVAFSVDGDAAGFAGYSGSGDYMSFILLGTALGNYVSAVFWGMGYSMKNEMDAGVLESNWLAPLPRPLLLVGRTFTSILFNTINSIATLLIAGLIFGFEMYSHNLMPALLSLIPMLLGLYGFGFAFAALVLLMRDANTLVDVGSFLVSLLSGENFPVKVLPRWLLPVSLVIPITYGYDLIRGYLIQTYTLLPAWQETIILIVFMFLMVYFGINVLDKLDRHVRTTGALGKH
jgi:ABC-2 type transport system permease protein